MKLLCASIDRGRQAAAADACAAAKSTPPAVGAFCSGTMMGACGAKKYSPSGQFLCSRKHSISELSSRLIGYGGVRVRVCAGGEGGGGGWRGGGGGLEGGKG